MTRTPIASSSRRRRVAGIGAAVALAAGGAGDARAGVIFGNTGTAQGFRWDAAPRTIAGQERSLACGLRYSLQGGSYTAFRDQFQWQGGNVPGAAAFLTAVDKAFNAWTVADPVSGFGTTVRFAYDPATPVVGTGMGGATRPGPRSTCWPRPAATPSWPATPGCGPSRSSTPRRAG